jgi:hypothetical protein
MAVHVQHGLLIVVTICEKAECLLWQGLGGYCLTPKNTIRRQRSPSSAHRYSAAVLNAGMVWWCKVRELIYREILEYHPGVLADYLQGPKQQPTFMYPSALDNFKKQWAHLESGGTRSGISGNAGLNQVGPHMSSRFLFYQLSDGPCVLTLHCAGLVFCARSKATMRSAALMFCSPS